MTQEEILKKVPYFKPLEFSEDDVILMLMRVGGNLEGIQSLRSNPEIAPRVNDGQVKLISQMAQVLLGLQIRLSQQEDSTQAIDALTKDLKKAKELVAVLTEQKSLLLDELEKIKREE